MGRNAASYVLDLSGLLGLFRVIWVVWVIRVVRVIWVVRVVKVLLGCCTGHYDYECKGCY